MAKDKMINSTESVKGGGTPGLDQTLKDMDQYDMNVLKDKNTGKSGSK